MGWINHGSHRNLILKKNEERKMKKGLRISKLLVGILQIILAILISAQAINELIYQVQGYKLIHFFSYNFLFYFLVSAIYLVTGTLYIATNKSKGITIDGINFGLMITIFIIGIVYTRFFTRETFTYLMIYGIIGLIIGITFFTLHFTKSGKKQVV